MRANCEVCGSPLRASPNRVEIDGAIMVVCNNCARLGRQIGPTPSSPSSHSPATTRRAFNPPRGSPFRPISSRPSAPMQPAPNPEYEVDPDYHLKIRQAREKLGLSQEQLGKLLNEKPSVIKMVESKKLKPDASLTRKLMHELKINLLVSLSELEGGRTTGT